MFDTHQYILETWVASTVAVAVVQLIPLLVLALVLGFAVNEAVGKSSVRLLPALVSCVFSEWLVKSIMTMTQIQASKVASGGIASRHHLRKELLIQGFQ